MAFSGDFEVQFTHPYTRYYWEANPGTGWEDATTVLDSIGQNTKKLHINRATEDQDGTLVRCTGSNPNGGSQVSDIATLHVGADAVNSFDDIEGLVGYWGPFESPMVLTAPDTPGELAPAYNNQTAPNLVNTGQAAPLRLQPSLTLLTMDMNLPFNTAGFGYRDEDGTNIGPTGLTVIVGERKGSINQGNFVFEVTQGDFSPEHFINQYYTGEDYAYQATVSSSLNQLDDQLVDIQNTMTALAIGPGSNNARFYKDGESVALTNNTPTTINHVTFGNTVGRIDSNSCRSYPSFYLVYDRDLTDYELSRVEEIMQYYWENFRGKDVGEGHETDYTIGNFNDWYGYIRDLRGDMDEGPEEIENCYQDTSQNRFILQTNANVNPGNRHMVVAGRKALLRYSASSTPTFGEWIRDDDDVLNWLFEAENGTTINKFFLENPDERMITMTCEVSGNFAGFRTGQFGALNYERDITDLYVDSVNDLAVVGGANPTEANRTLYVPALDLLLDLVWFAGSLWYGTGPDAEAVAAYFKANDGNEIDLILGDPP